MFDSISFFVNDIIAYDFDISLNVKIGLIITIIVALCIGTYFLHDIFNINNMQGGLSWFIFVAILNLITLLAIFLYYNRTQVTYIDVDGSTKKGAYIGPQGKSGKIGRKGKKGTYVSCNYCNTNIYLTVTSLLK